MHESQLFAAQRRRKKIWKNFVFLLRKITFEPDIPGTWKRGKRAKRFVPWKFWPGVAPCSGHFQNFVCNWQRQRGNFWVVQVKKANFCQKLVQFLSKTYLCTRNWMGNKTVLHVRCGNTTHLHWYLEEIGQKHQNWPTGSDRKRYFRREGGSNPDQSTPIRHTQQSSTIVWSTSVALEPTVLKI